MAAEEIGSDESPRRGQNDRSEQTNTQRGQRSSQCYDRTCRGLCLHCILVNQVEGKGSRVSQVGHVAPDPQYWCSCAWRPARGGRSRRREFTSAISEHHRIVCSSLLTQLVHRITCRKPLLRNVAQAANTHLRYMAATSLKGRDSVLVFDPLYRWDDSDHAPCGHPLPAHQESGLVLGSVELGIPSPQGHMTQSRLAALSIGGHLRATPRVTPQSQVSSKSCNA